MLSELQCQVCQNEFSETNLPRLISTCGHTFCETCLDTMLSEVEGGEFKITCPQHREDYFLKTGDVTQFPKNIQLIKVIEAKRNTAPPFKDESLEITKIPLKEDSRGNESEQEIINQMEENSKEEEPEGSMCLVHQKPMDIVCLVDLEKLCAKCAIFGEHRGHDFKSIECIEQECNSHKEEIISVYNQKEGIEQRVANQGTRKDILALLQQHKSKLQKEINEKHRKLQEKIRRAEEISLRKLEELSVKTEGKIRGLIKLDEHTEREYEDWQQQSFGKVLKLEEGAFQQKLQILYGSNNIDTIISRGEAIVARMKQQESSILNQVEAVIESIAVDFNDEIFSHVDSFSKVMEYPKQGKMVSEIKAPQVQHRLPSLTQQCLLESDPAEQKEEAFRASCIPVFQPREKSNEQLPVELSVEKIQRPSLTVVEQPKLQKVEKVAPVLADRPSKKKLKSIKVPQKLEKVLQALYLDSLELLDLTNSEIGDTVVLQIGEFLRGSRVRTAKFIRCKLTDDCVGKLIPSLGNISTLYLSQNLLTQASIQHLINGRDSLPQLKSVILSQNKIIERKHKPYIDRLKKLDINVSV